MIATNSGSQVGLALDLLGSTSKTTLLLAPPDLTATVTTDASATGRAVSTPNRLLTDDKPHVVGMRRTGDTLEVFADGGSATVTKAATADASGAVVLGNLFEGALCEVVVTAGALGATDLERLTQYLAVRYAAP